MKQVFPEWWGEAVTFLRSDELLSGAIERYGTYPMSSKSDLFQTLIRSIVGQQISVAASEAIWKRLNTHLGTINPEAVLKSTQTEIAACGVTRPKAGYIFGLALASEELINQPYDSMSDDEIKKHLIQFKGIGPWTAEMMLMFHFLRQDVFSIGDIGLIRAIQNLVPDASSHEDILTIAERWKPYRTAACWYLWRTIDPEPVEY